MLKRSDNLTDQLARRREERRLVRLTRQRLSVPQRLAKIARDFKEWTQRKITQPSNRKSKPASNVRYANLNNDRPFVTEIKVASVKND